MPSLGLDSMHDTPAPQTDKKSKWNTGLTVFVALIILAFTWIVVSNMYSLYFGKPLISH